jgi:hypothetical protein
MRKKILLFSRDPGGSNAIIPLVKPLKLKGYSVRLFGKDIALNQYAKAGLSAFNIMDFVKNAELKDVELFLKKESPNFIITGTSSDDFTEKYMWKSAEILGIPSFAIIDQWINYGIRFSEYDVSQVKKYNKNKIYPYLPTKILVMDEKAKNETIQDGLNPLRIEVTGQPHFETIFKKRINDKKIKKIRSNYDLGTDDFMIIFASEPISDIYKENGNAKYYWGYTEKTVFIEFLSCINSIINTSNKKIVILIKLHPKDNINKYDNIVNNFGHDRIKIYIDKYSDPYDLIIASDLICGMSSMFLIESIILDKPVLSIQIGLKRENPFVLDRVGILKSILTKNELTEKLIDIIVKEKFLRYKFKVIRNPVKNVINLMEKYICQN